MDLSRTLEVVTKSDVGMVRSHNEDAVYANPVFGLAILADGMGGYNAGEVASGMVTTLLGNGLEQAFARRGLPDCERPPAAGAKRAGSGDRPRQQRDILRRRRASRSTPAWARRWWWRCSTTIR